MEYKIKHKFTGKVLFSHECGSMRLAVEAAVTARANLSRANLYVADLSGANLSGANLYGADLSGANLYGATLHGADLSGANLYGATLHGADLYGANLYGANLSRVNLSEADLSGANLHGAELYGAELYGAKIQNEITIEQAPIHLSGLNYFVTILDSHIIIGCEFHSMEEWFGFTNKRITEMDSKAALKFWRTWKQPIMDICIADKRYVI